MNLAVIAIDGPAGVGKSSVARALAKRLGFFLLDTGAIYRSLALFASQQGVSFDDGPGLGALAAGLPIRFGRGDQDGQVFLNDVSVTDAIRSPEISLAASLVSAHPEVRRELLDLQRRLSCVAPCVVEGRDIGTVVLPNAPVKFFLTASPEVRAARRQKELLARGIQVDKEATLREQQERDLRDQNRAAAPLRCADDALVVDTGELSFEQVLELLVELATQYLKRGVA